MSVIHKLIKYAISEVEMAEKYIKLAKEVHDPAIAVKLQEIAKDELRHCDFDQMTAMKMIEKAKSEEEKDGLINRESIHESVDLAFFDVYSDWKDNVKYMVDTFEAKK